MAAREVLCSPLDAMHLAFFALKRAYHSTLRLTRAGLAEMGLTAARFDLLFALSEYRQGLLQGSLLRVLGVGRTTVSRMLGALEKLGLVERTVVKRDRRRKRVVMTPLGRSRIALAYHRFSLSGWAQLAVDCALCTEESGYRWFDNVDCRVATASFVSVLGRVRHAFVGGGTLHYPPFWDDSEPRDPPDPPVPDHLDERDDLVDDFPSAPPDPVESTATTERDVGPEGHGRQPSTVRDRTERRKRGVRLGLLSGGENGGGDLREAFAHGAARNVPRRDAEPSDTGAHVGDAERGTERGEARGIVTAVAGEGVPHEDGARVGLAELPLAEANGAGRLVIDVECGVKVHAGLRGPRSSAGDLGDNEPHAGVGQGGELADVPGDVADAKRGVVGEASFGNGFAHTAHESAKALTARLASRGVARVEANDGSSVADQVQGAVLGDTPVDRPLADEDLAPPARPPRHGDEEQSRVTQVPERIVGGPGQHPVGQKRVVEVEEQATEPAGLVAA
jgi:DNA-binding MarR family transcriptional regulator